ncbi:MAG: nucleotidyltransferase family protein [Armatimonadota bacterium]
MKAIILAAGYAVRLRPLTLNKPKPLLPINKKPIVDYIMKHIKKIKEIDEVLIVTNDKFSKNFNFWKKKIKAASPKITVINDGTKSDADKLGAIGDIRYTLNKGKVKDDVLIIAGDNIFEFDMKKFFDFFKSKKNIVALKYVKNKKLLPHYGIVKVDKNKRMTSFEEKPQKPKSNLASICCYFFEKGTLKYVDKYLKNKLNKDAPGNFIAWLHKQIPVYGFIFKEGWFDIGDMGSYKRADRLYAKKAKTKTKVKNKKRKKVLTSA